MTQMRTKRGSEWHRWDPHLHAPGTLLGDGYGNDWDGFLARIERAQPIVRAIGVADYFCIQTYRRVREYRNDGRLTNVELIFPNVEMRLNIETERKKGINIHLLFSPDDPAHESEIERILGHLEFEYKKSQYRCDLEGLARLGRAFDASVKDQSTAVRVGANQFKVHLRDLQDLFHKEAWLSHNCLVAIAAAEGDGTSGLQADASFAATREEIERFANIIFSGKPGDRDYWLGKKAGFPAEEIERKYGCLKPCLHGSDAHRTEKILAPDLERSCWIKAELSFEGLRQAVIEPEQRVAIGKDAPVIAADHERIVSVSATDANWFSNGTIELNPGLVAIIGARGSGKTAIADIIASAAGAMTSDVGDASFVRRASHPVNLIGSVRATIEWGNAETTSRRLSETFDESFDDPPPPRVRYLSQQFVEQLCSSDGLARALVAEIEAVVFAAIDQTDRLGAATFDELRALHVDALRTRRGELESDVERLSEQIATSDTTHEKVGAVRKKHAEVSARMRAAKAELEKLVPKGSDVRARRLAAFDVACQTAEGIIQSVRLVRQRLDELRADVKRTRETQSARVADLRTRYNSLGLTALDWDDFTLQFAGDVDGILDKRAAALDVEIKKRLDGEIGVTIDLTKEPTDAWPVNILRAERVKLQGEVGADVAKTKRVGEIAKSIAQLETEARKLEDQISLDVTYDDRREQLRVKRREAYAAVFGVLQEEQHTLERLYAPITKHIGDAPLQLVVRRRIDTDTWIAAGERLLDLRAAGELRGRGALKRACSSLVEAWRTGGAHDVAGALETFLKKHWEDIRKGRPAPEAATASKWLDDIARWLFSTGHIRLEYGLMYGGQDVERLSPGTRGIVLLTLYLAIDEWDTRPLLIDQPEENLDPKSVFDELVAYFRSARLRRQVILVTHNANLVVNTDADQVIVAHATPDVSGGLPTFSYRSGGLEEPTIRRDVCSLLEGGERAFLERERRYRFDTRRP